MTALARIAAKRGARVLPSAVLLQRVPTRKAAVAITFDDGPYEDTQELLAILDDLGILATFFVVGKNVEKYPEQARAIERSGHELAAHGYGHRRLQELTNRDLALEIERTERLLPPAWGKRPLFRPPWGEVSPRSLWVTASLGFTTALWSFDSLDSRGISASSMVERFRQNALVPGDVVLFHEGEKATRQALPRIVAELANAGLGAAPLSLMVASAHELSPEKRATG